MTTKKSPVVYQTTHPHSKVITSAFAQGCKGRIVPSQAGLLEGDAAFYGILRGTGEILKECSLRNRDYYYIDHGYFNAGHYDGYYRVVRNDMQLNGEVLGYTPEEIPFAPTDRWNKLKIKMKPWRKSGNHIVVCPLSQFVGDFLGINTELWLRETIRELEHYTDRSIFIKEKDTDMPIEEAVKDAHAVVAYNSNALVDAVIEGIPVYALGPSSTDPIARKSLRDIENPIMEDREKWACALSYGQWTLDEIRMGVYWEHCSRSNLLEDMLKEKYYE